MEKLTRIEAPQWLLDNWKSWGREWKQACDESDNKAKFSWHGKDRYSQLCDKLKQQTLNHCSFCDSFRIGGDIKPTIEHFRPKKRYHRLAYYWPNLFICCHYCQEKGSRFDKALLKPDADDYDFDYYFDIDWENGELLPNIERSEQEQARAEFTIKLYKLNENEKPEARKRALKNFVKGRHEIDEQPYRFFIRRSAKFNESLKPV